MNRYRQHHQQQHGNCGWPIRRAFTLMEVCVALAIFGFMAAVLLQSVISIQEALVDVRTTTGREEAKRFVLRRIMAATNAENLTSGGTIALDNGGAVNWSASLEEPENASIPDLHIVTIELSWDEGATETLRLRTFRPEWSDPTTRSTLIQKLREEYPQSRFTTF